MGRQAEHDDNGVKKTVKTYDKFAKWDGWGGNETAEFDHVLVSINVDGEMMLPDMDSQYEDRKILKLGSSRLSVGERHYYSVGGVFHAVDMPLIYKRLCTKSPRRNLRIKSMITRNEFGDTLVWECYKGEVVLISVNGEHYTTLTEKELTIAADNMYFDGCEIKRDERVVGFVCGIGDKGEKIKRTGPTKRKNGK